MNKPIIINLPPIPTLGQTITIEGSEENDFIICQPSTQQIYWDEEREQYCSIKPKKRIDKENE